MAGSPAFFDKSRASATMPDQDASSFNKNYLKNPYNIPMPVGDPNLRMPVVQIPADQWGFVSASSKDANIHHDPAIVNDYLKRDPKLTFYEIAPEFGLLSTDAPLEEYIHPSSIDKNTTIQRIKTLIKTLRFAWHAVEPSIDNKGEVMETSKYLIVVERELTKLIVIASRRILKPSEIQYIEQIESYVLTLVQSSQQSDFVKKEVKREDDSDYSDDDDSDSDSGGIKGIDKRIITLENLIAEEDDDFRDLSESSDNSEATYDSDATSVSEIVAKYAAPPLSSSSLPAIASGEVDAIIQPSQPIPEMGGMSVSGGMGEISGEPARSSPEEEEKEEEKKTEEELNAKLMKPEKTERGIRNIEWIQSQATASRGKNKSPHRLNESDMVKLAGMLGADKTVKSRKDSLSFVRKKLINKDHYAITMFTEVVNMHGFPQNEQGDVLWENLEKYKSQKRTDREQRADAREKRNN